MRPATVDTIPLWVYGTRAVPRESDAKGQQRLPEHVIDDLRTRLRRVEGQVRGVEAMLADGRECRDVVTQLRAANRALEQVGFRLIASGLAYCLEHPSESSASGYPLAEVQRLFTKLRLKPRDYADGVDRRSTMGAILRLGTSHHDRDDDVQAERDPARVRVSGIAIA